MLRLASRKPSLPKPARKPLLSRTAACEWCRATFTKRKNRQRFCGHDCRLAWLHSLPTRRRYDRLLGRYVDRGYVRGEVWLGDRRVKAREHRLMLEWQLGRALEPGEIVHHVNRNRADNRPENLRLYPSHSEHMRDAHTRRRVSTEQLVDAPAVDNTNQKEMPCL